MLEFLIAFAVIFALVALVVAIINVPVFIATARGIVGSDKTIIIVLSWLGIFFGLTWIVALILSLVWGRMSCGCDNLDKLEKLAKLYKDKAISKSEFDEMKAKLIK